MGLFKPLLPFAGKPAVERVTDEIKMAGINRLLVVTGHEHEKVERLLYQKGVSFCYNEDYREGMFTSIKAGLRELYGEERKCSFPNRELALSGFFLHPVDCALITKETYKTMLREIEKDPVSLAVACFKGKNGHPLYVPSRFVEEILFYEGGEGMKFLTKKYADELRKIEVEEPAVLWDMDRIEDYQKMIFSLEGIAPETVFHLRRLHLIRHGEILQHDAPILLGQTDIPLSEKGREQALDAGKKLRQLSPHVAAIYTSDLSRTRETAKLIADHWTPPLVPQEKKGLRELFLGDWDGHYVEEIRKNHPEEFEERGQNLLLYKVSGGGENFFELQHRVIRALDEIIQKTDGEAAIVTHGGVIRSILSHLLALPLEELIHIKVPNGQILTILWPDPLKTKEN